jgi:ADP-heptose:LPS heptosyltransferase
VPGLERLIVIRKKPFSLHWISLWFKCLFTKWDVAIDIRGTGLTYFLITSKRLIWKSSSDTDLRVHQLARFMGLSETPANKIWLSPLFLKKATELLPEGPTYMALSPTANWSKKCWPLDSFQDLAKYILAHPKKFPQVKLVVFGTASQRADVQPLFDHLPADKIIDLMGLPHLLLVAATMERCQAFVGNDSGLMHLAAALDVPCLGLFGPSPHTIYGPWGKKTSIARVNLPLDEIWARVHRGEDVMQLLSVKEVAKALEGLI